jgi:SAM-dependent methyltransferase
VALVSCNICGWTGQEFETLYDFDNARCCQCGAYERHRALVYYLEKTGTLPEPGIALEVGSSAIQAFGLYLQQKGWRYHSIDFWPGSGSVQSDAAALPFKDSCFDLTICTHVLEHVQDDFQTLSELKRVMKPSATAVIQVPFDDRTFQTQENRLPEENHRWRSYHYHHKRDYGLDILERLAFFFRRVTEVHPLTVILEEEAKLRGFENRFGTTFFCEKSLDGMPYPGTLERNLLPIKRHWMTERRAYEIFLSASGEGTPLDHWLRAESEIQHLDERTVMERNVYCILGRCAQGSSI